MPTSPQPPLASDEPPEHVRLNRAVWDQWAAEYATYCERAAEPGSGLWDCATGHADKEEISAIKSSI